MTAPHDLAARIERADGPAERAAIVEYLHETAASYGMLGDIKHALAVEALALAIERGDHLKGTTDD